MELLVCKDEEQWLKTANHWCEQYLSSAKSIYMPAGQTPARLYQKWQIERPTFLNSLSLVQIDEVLAGPKAGIFRHFFIEHLPSYGSQFEWINQANTQADAALLGLGLNGHVGFHEPGIAADFYSGCVRLSPTTCRHLQLEPNTTAVTYGTGAFMATKAILMIIRGESKRSIFKEFLSNNKNLPAQALKQHHQLTVLTDIDPSSFD